MQRHHIIAILAFAFSGLIAPTGASAYQTGSVSEEYPPGVCDIGDAVYAATCSGSYCDNTTFYCADTNWPVTHRSWSSYFSEEGTNYRYCGADQIMSGISCSGSYCDNVSIECSTVPTSRHNCEWIGPFSEEQSYRSFDGKYASGMQCTGSNCDNHWYYVCSY